MTPCSVLSAGTIDLYFYGELQSAERDSIERHVEACAECRLALEDLSAIRAALASRPVIVAPPSGDWRAFMDRLDRSIHAGAAAAPVSPVAAFRLPAGSAGPRRAASTSRVYGFVAMAALLALVTMSVLFVARARQDAARIETAAPRAADSPPAAERSADAAFASLSEQHFERSKLVVLGLATKDAQHTSAADWTYERELASTLLDDTRMYRLAAEQRGMQRLAGVMRDLELVLLQTSLTDDRDPAALAQIQRLIRKRDLLEKIDVVTTAGL